MNPLVIQAASQHLLEAVEPLPRRWVVAGRDEVTTNSDEVPEQVHVPDPISDFYALEESCQLFPWGSRCVVH
ncbi:MAG: hypothetical protein K2X49_16635 [Acetobacteraceae bacterium]|nr:hypothetical protein [Acetobacteraceae bacterium]